MNESPSQATSNTELSELLRKARSGGTEEAFHGLRSLDASVMPSLQAAFHLEQDPIVRAVIVHAVWQQTWPGLIGFLAAALGDPADEVWKEALDGLVSVASAEARKKSSN